MSAQNISDPVLLDVTNLPVVNPDSVKPVYCNNATTTIAPWDVRLIFSEVVTTGQPGVANHELRASVSMNPGHAKALIDALRQTIEAYEKNYGEIKLPNSSPASAVKS
jgi:hypothetical protein